LYFPPTYSTDLNVNTFLLSRTSIVIRYINIVIYYARFDEETTSSLKAKPLTSG